MDLACSVFIFDISKKHAWIFSRPAHEAKLKYHEVGIAVATV